MRRKRIYKQKRVKAIWGEIGDTMHVRFDRYRLPLIELKFYMGKIEDYVDVLHPAIERMRSEMEGCDRLTIKHYNQDDEYQGYFVVNPFGIYKKLNVKLYE